MSEYWDVYCDLSERVESAEGDSGADEDGEGD